MNHLALRRRASMASLFVGVFVFALKMYAYRLTQSSAIYSDAMEGIVNILAAVFLVFSISYAAKPADEDHPYGHGKVEFLTSVFEGGLIGFAAIVIMIDSIQSFLSHRPLTDLTTGIQFVFIAAAINLALGLYLLRIGKRVHSEALMTDGKHVLSDVITSVSVLVGVAIVHWSGFEWIDKALGLAVGVFLIRTSFMAIRQSLGALLDAQSVPVLKRLVDAFNRLRSDPVIHIHHLRAIRSGALVHVDAHIVLPEFWTLETCHYTLESFEKDLRAELKTEVDFHFHLDPCMKSYCSQCPVEPCPIRVKPFQQSPDFSLDQLLLRDEQLPSYLESK